MTGDCSFIDRHLEFKSSASLRSLESPSSQLVVLVMGIVTYSRASRFGWISKIAIGEIECCVFSIPKIHPSQRREPQIHPLTEFLTDDNQGQEKHQRRVSMSSERRVSEPVYKDIYI